MDKKLTGGAAALMGALLYGGAQLMGMDERLEALEALHPELSQEEVNEAAEDVKSEKPEKTLEPVKKPKPAEEPAEEPESAPEPAESPEAADPDGE